MVDAASLRAQVLGDWAAQDPRGALEALIELLPELHAGVLGNPLISQIAERIGEKDPRLVLDWLEALPDEFRLTPSIAAARQWAKTEPEAALSWCMEHEIDVAHNKWERFTMSTDGVLAAALRAQPDAAVGWLEHLPAGPERDRLLEQGLDESLRDIPKERLFSSDASL